MGLSYKVNIVNIYMETNILFHFANSCHIASPTGKNSINTGVSVILSPKSEKNVRMETKNATIEMIDII